MKRLSIIMVLFILVFAFSCLDAGDAPVGRQNSDIPTVKATAPVNIAYNGVTLTGNVESANGYRIKSRGFYYSTQNNPSKGNGTHVSVPLTSDGIGEISAEINGLDSYTNYYYIAYAENEKGFQYSDVITFKTWAETPTVDTKDISEVIDGNISITGIIISEGAFPVTECGICWSTIHQEPTTADDFRRSTDKTGDYTVTLQNRAGSKTYYFRAYAENNKGISYGQTITLQAPLIWEQMETFSGDGRISSGTFTLGHSFYVVAGDGGSAPLKDTWGYNSYAGSWKQMTEFPGIARKAPSSFVIGNKGYVGLGQSGSVTLSDFYYYIQSANEWNAIELHFPGTPRALATSFSLNNKGYIVGGRIIGGSYYEYVSDMWQYSLAGGAGTWKNMNPFPMNVFGGVGFTLQGKAYIALVANHNKVWEYNEASDSWNEISEAPADLYTDNMDAGITGAAVVEDIVYFVDGKNQIWSFNPETKIWIKKSTMPTMITPNQIMFVDEHDIYVGLNQYSKIFYKYKPLWDNQ